ncbi:MAG: hypothetical protein L7U62_08075 [Candidatus Poseidoniaceae archaeon]|nr:hypothetical protein [Candidatus Poseidoniaceae archaeon]
MSKGIESDRLPFDMDKKVCLALWLASIMLVTPLAALSQHVAGGNLEPSEVHKPHHGIHTDLSFNTSDGFALSNVSIDASNGEALLERPVLSMQSLTNSSLMSPRTGACATYVEDAGKVYLMGGIIDPDPVQSNDEEPTRSLEAFSIVNGTWEPLDSTMPVNQMYFGCTTIGPIIYAVGDHHPFTTPEIRSEGLLQIFNTSNSTWYAGALMPGSNAVGLAAVEDLGGFVYSAGGVGRKDRSDFSNATLRYNPQTNTWDQMANMSLARHSFTLTEFHGKLYAMGGIARQYDPVSGQYYTAPTNHTEVYDAQNDVWMNHTALPFDVAAHAATVHNNEIILAGGVTGTGWGAQTNEVHGYNPLTEQWTIHTDLPNDIYDLTLTGTNDSILYAAGDSSSSRFSTWSTNYVDDSGIYYNPASQSGWITSSLIDLRQSTNGVASPVWLQFNGTLATDTDLRLQYRFGASPSDTTSSVWKPLGPQSTSEYYQTGNHSLTEQGEGMSFIQYRIQMETSELDKWFSPDLDSVEIYAEEASLLSSIPATMHPNAAQITLQTFHSSFSVDANYSLLLHQTNVDGFTLPSSDSANITWNSNTATFTVHDPANILRQSDLDVQVQSTSHQGDTLNWDIAINAGITSDYIAPELRTYGHHNSIFQSPEVIEIKNILDVHVTSYQSAFTSVGDASLTENEVFPDGVDIEITVDHSFNESGTRLLYGLIEARIHVDVLSPSNGWFNSTGEWTPLTTGMETVLRHTLSNDSSGDARLWIEARTQDDFVLNVNPSSKHITVNVDSPVETSKTPLNNSYINEEQERSVVFSFFDVGGFNTDSVKAYLWIEAEHDTNSDGIASENERVETPLYISNTGNDWTLNLTVNDTANNDHQMVHVTLEGTNLAGKAIRADGQSKDFGKTSWMSRTPQKANITLVESLFDATNETIQRIEPTGHFGWHVVVSDSNALTDIAEVRLVLGDDEGLGMVYRPTQNTCAALDARISVDASCYAEVVNNTYSLWFIGTADWTFTTSGLEIGHVLVEVDDYDGTQTMPLSGEWTLERELSIDFEVPSDAGGSVQGNLEPGWSIVSGEDVLLNATVLHERSETPYNGALSVFWRGKVQDEFFSQSYAVEVTEGQLSARIQAPTGAGLWHQTVLEIWDPYNAEQLFSTELPNMLLDNNPPLLVPSSMTSGISRYRLESVEIGVNIDESTSWTGNLTLSCQIRSLNFDWPVLTQIREPTTVFDGKTLFSFVFNFAEQGDPSTLSTQSSIACWATGFDDAGLPLASTGGNSETSPWLTSSLNNIGPDLAIGGVSFEGENSGGATYRVAVEVQSIGETIENTFNVTLSTVQDGVVTVVGRELVTGMQSDSNLEVRSSFTVPDGDWSLLIELDAEHDIWELSETNNVWSQNYSQDTDGFSFSTAALAGGVGILLLFIILAFTRRSKGSTDDEGVLTEVARPLSGPPQRTQSAVKPSNLSGPPPRTPVSEAIEETGFSATTVAVYANLPGGGTYSYDGGITVYSGPEIGSWQQNEDESFTRIA